MSRIRNAIDQKAPSPWQRAAWYATAAVSGAAILGIEILGANALAPFFGTSHFVWTAQITVTLLAAATLCCRGGPWAGCVVAVYWALLAAAAYLGVAALQIGSVAEACGALPLPSGTLLTSAVLFFVSLALLATTGIALARSWVASFEHSGTRLGLLSAVDTLGSVLATLLVGSLLVPLLANAAILPCAAGALCLLAALFFPEVHSDNRRHSEGICQRIMDVDPWKASLLTDDLNPGKYYDAPKHRETRRLMISLMQSVAREGAIP